MRPFRSTPAWRRLLLCLPLVLAPACAAERLEARASDGPAAASTPTPNPRPTELSTSEHLLAPPPDAGAPPAPHRHGYVCPMHPEQRSEAPGRCPVCGMNLVPEGKP